jgi:ribonuclease HI
MQGHSRTRSSNEPFIGGQDSNADAPSEDAEMNPGSASRVVCFFDGSCPGNQSGGTGPMRAAFVVDDTKIVRPVPDLSTPNGPMRSNNIAEYFGLIFLLQHLHDLERKTSRRGAYLVCGDSELVIRQMRGEYRVRARHLRPLHDEASRLSSGLDVEFRHVRRERNPAGFLLE